MEKMIKNNEMYQIFPFFKFFSLLAHVLSAISPVRSELIRPTWRQPAKPIYPHIVACWMRPELTRFVRFTSVTATAPSNGHTTSRQYPAHMHDGTFELLHNHWS
jgi:hypothetical protein